MNNLLKRLMIGVFIPLAIMANPTSSAPAKQFGLGIVLGSPTGLSAKYWLSQERALDFALAWGWGNQSNYGGAYYDDDKCYDYSYYKNNKGWCGDRANYDYYGGGGFHFHGDYVFHNFSVFKTREPFALYYGPGLSFEYWRHYDALLGVRGLVGVTWLPRSAPFDMYLELAPTLNLTPGTFVYFNGGLGGRFYF